jgi:spermidine synthase
MNGMTLGRMPVPLRYVARGASDGASLAPGVRARRLPEATCLDGSFRGESGRFEGAHPLAIVVLLFFLSGASSLVYEVAWARSLSLVFGGSHLAVTTVLAVYMGGLALGSALVGRRADRVANPVRLYGLLELGVSGFALLFLLLVRLYPALYPPLARLGEDSPAYLSMIRVLFAALAMLGPTTLMGATLPALTRAASLDRRPTGREIALLYGVNTLGAVAGTLACGFVLLPRLGVRNAQLVAVAASGAVGLAALALPARLLGGRAGAAPDRAGDDPAPDGGSVPVRTVLWAIGASGFCALGYEVLWTRMLGLVLGTSVYSFTIILAAFLGGIALGSAAVAGLQRWRPGRVAVRVAGLGLVEILAGATALFVTVHMRDLPAQASQLQIVLSGWLGTEFASRQWSSFLVASAYFFVPAFMLGAAFPIAGALVAEARQRTGGAVGDVLTSNTVGAILGASFTGFVLVHLFGIERSLHLLGVLNVGVGVVVVAGVARSRWPARIAVAALVAALAGLVASPEALRFWDRKFFAVYTNNFRENFDTPEKRRDILSKFDVLYYFEGANETISALRARDGIQSFVVNGRTEASTWPEDVQLQYALGHLPVLLHPDPRRVFVLGTGAGMTLGAASVHPEVERIVLAEIERGVLPATRTFGTYNHDVLSSPKLRIVFNDGRNHLMTTGEKFDVVTADPIHPWSGGAAYLYTSEYFGTMAARLAPGGVAAQWLPLYELSREDVKSVVRTFSEHFRHVLVWKTYWDAVIVGSNAPFQIDEESLARRIAVPAVGRDLARIGMGSAESLLSYFLLGDRGARGYGGDGVVNTDDNLFLEFSAPRSIGAGHLTGANVQDLGAWRESILPYLRPSEGEEARREQVARWQRLDAAGRLYDPVHVMALWEEQDQPAFAQAFARAAAASPGYAPLRFLRQVVRQGR